VNLGDNHGFHTLVANLKYCPATMTLTNAVLGQTVLTTTTHGSQTMTHESNPCAQCQPVSRIEVAETQFAALSRFRELFKQGRFPSMCQHQNGVFHVCYAEAQDKTEVPQRVNRAIR